MGSHCTVVMPPALDDHAGLMQGGEAFPVVSSRPATSAMVSRLSADGSFGQHSLRQTCGRYSGVRGSAARATVVGSFDNVANSVGNDWFAPGNAPATDLDSVVSWATAVSPA